jgi:uncharacterized protein YfaP (DUF2135 family)
MIARNVSLIVAALATITSLWVGGAAAGDLTPSVSVDNYVQVSRTRVDRSTYEFVYRATAKNNGSSADNVIATVSGVPAGVTLIDDTLTIGSLNGGAAADDTFSFRVSRGTHFEAQQLDWTVSGDPRSTTPGSLFTPGAETPLVQQLIGVSGGTIVLENTGTPLDGITVSIPPGALDTAETFTVGYNSGNLNPVDGRASGIVLTINAGGSVEFNHPVRITVPFHGDPDEVPVPYYIDPDGRLHAAQIVRLDRDNNLFVFQTFHASWFSWLIPTTYAPSPEDIIDTGYDPDSDGFQVSNNGSQYNRGGECLGMTSFSLWYFDNHSETSGALYDRFYDVVGQDSAGDDLRGQDVIATRAFISIAQQWNSYIPSVAAEQNLTDAEQYASIRNQLQNTGAPVLIYLYDNNSHDAEHSVLAYGLFDLSGDIDIYDPNHPGQARTIHYDADSESFDDYSGYSGIVYNGDGSLFLTESYGNILSDAELDFQGSGNATINVTSHTSGQQVGSRNATLQGVIESVEVLVDKLTVLVGETAFVTNVPEGGSFSIPLQLEESVNHLAFQTEGRDTSGNAVTVGSNMDTQDFTLDAVVQRSVILMTLTWDTNDTDLDTYVIDPTGDYSSYWKQTTADGGELDRDVTTGYGPEHWTLENTDVVRYGQPYRFRVHYYSDHGNGPTNYTVTIKLYEGTDREATTTYRGNLAVSNPENSQPTDTGPDWVDIATVVLTDNQATSARASISLHAAGNSDVRITVPVPPQENLRK